MARNLQSRQKPIVFLDYLSRKVQAEQPQHLGKINYVLNSYFRQEHGHKSISTVMNEVNSIVGEQYWGKVYHDFMSIWSQIEQHRAASAMPENPTSMMEGRGNGSASGAVIDLTESANEEDDTAVAVDSGQVPLSARQDANVHLLSQVAAMQPPQPVELVQGPTVPSRRRQLPLQQPRHPGPPILDLSDRNPFRHLPAQQELVTQQAVAGLKKAPSSAPTGKVSRPVDGKQRHFALMTKVQKQAKDEIARAVVYVHNTMARLQTESPQDLYPKAISTIEDVLMRCQQREIGYEIVTGLIVEQLKALISFGNSSALAVGSPSSVAALVLAPTSGRSTLAASAPSDSNEEKERQQPPESQLLLSQQQPELKKRECKVKQQAEKIKQQPPSQARPLPQQSQSKEKVCNAAVDPKTKVKAKKEASVGQNQLQKEETSRKRKAENQAPKANADERKVSAAALGAPKRRMIKQRSEEKDDKYSPVPRSPSYSPPSRSPSYSPRPDTSSYSPPREGSRQGVNHNDESLRPSSPSYSPPRGGESDTGDSFDDSSNSDSGSFSRATLSSPGYGPGRTRYEQECFRFRSCSTRSMRGRHSPLRFRSPPSPSSPTGMQRRDVRRSSGTSIPRRQCEWESSCSSSDEDLSVGRQRSIGRHRFYSSDSSSGDEEEIPLSPEGPKTPLFLPPPLREDETKPAAKAASGNDVPVPTGPQKQTVRLVVQSKQMAGTKNQQGNGSA
jgi:hypothetical protein